MKAQYLGLNAMVPVFLARHVEAAVSPERALAAVRDAFLAYDRGEWSMPPKVYVPAYPAGDFRAMPALGGGHAALKWVTSFPGNPQRGLPTVTGLVLLSDASTGELRAVLAAAAVTALRTGRRPCSLRRRSVAPMPGARPWSVQESTAGRRRARSSPAVGRSPSGTSTLREPMSQLLSSAVPWPDRARRRWPPISS